MPKCAECGYELGHIDEACPECLPGFYRNPRDSKERQRAEMNGIPTPPEGDEGLPIPASQDPLRRLY